jgi:hypothetical protein
LTADATVSAVEWFSVDRIGRELDMVPIRISTSTPVARW